MRRGKGVACRIVAKPARAGGVVQAGGEYFGFAVAMGRSRPGGFKIAEKERLAYPSNDLEGLAHGEAGPLNIGITIYKGNEP
jgi:hypothetical protein